MYCNLCCREHDERLSCGEVDALESLELKEKKSVKRVLVEVYSVDFNPCQANINISLSNDAELRQVYALCDELKEVIFNKLRKDRISYKQGEQPL